MTSLEQGRQKGFESRGGGINLGGRKFFDPFAANFLLWRNQVVDLH